MIYKEIKDAKNKSSICNHVLRALPNYFGIEDSIKNYVNSVNNTIFYAVYRGLNSEDLDESDINDVLGFISIKIHNAYTAEIYVMGVLKDYHRKGIGRVLIELCINHCVKNNIKYLTVKTLDSSRDNIYYAKTRKFYKNMGFEPLEVFRTLWDENNPCLFMLKPLFK